ncbi:MAG: hypothetical protein C0616_06170 [Desulfuromonas sp.]|nr:MAG: hypothetical protein C0616_06170 [Desulfuromonas sp.]
METTRRSLIKAVSWRVLATAITMGLVYGLTGESDFAAKVGLADTGLKIMIYLGHERIWNRIPYGRKQPEYYI